LQDAGANAYPRRVETLDARARSAFTALIGVVLVWAVASLTLPRTDLGSIARDPDGAWTGPITALEAIASDRPTAAFDARRSEHPDAIPAVISAEAGTRSALLWVIGDERFPPSSIATSRLADGVVRRGPPLFLAL
jgi:hypothetical protein